MRPYLSMLIVSMIAVSCSKDDISTIDNTPPSVPANISVTNTTYTTTDLSWSASTDNIGVEEYLIFQDATFIVASESTGYKVTNLNPNTDYSFKIKAKDAVGNQSEFSKVVNVKTKDDTPTLVVVSGDIETYIGNIIDNLPGDSGNNYKSATNDQLSVWNVIIDAILANDIVEAVEKSAEVNYQITEFTDNSINQNQVFYILEERSFSAENNNWGIYIFSKTPEIDNLILMAPHTKNDLNTGHQAIYTFKNILAKAVFFNGTHRCNSSSFSSCSGTTSTCNSGSEPFRISDLAHNTNSAFQKSTEIVYSTVTNSVFVQLHGFGKKSTDPYVIISNGTQITPTLDYAVMIKDALLVEDNSLTFKIAHIDTEWTRLRGFSNTQGRLINNSSNHCSMDAITCTGRFIHIEQEKTKLRDDASKWIKMSNALQYVFNK